MLVDFLVSWGVPYSVAYGVTSVVSVVGGSLLITFALFKLMTWAQRIDARNAAKTKNSRLARYAFRIYNDYTSMQDSVTDLMSPLLERFAKALSDRDGIEYTPRQYTISFNRVTLEARSSEHTTKWLFPVEWLDAPDLLDRIDTAVKRREDRDVREADTVDNARMVGA